MDDVADFLGNGFVATDESDFEGAGCIWSDGDI
jgi:hypothetical protein